MLGLMALQRGTNRQIDKWMDRQKISSSYRTLSTIWDADQRARNLFNRKNLDFLFNADTLNIYLSVIQIAFLLTDIDDCVSLPCQNNGTCIDLVNEYKCKCDTLFTGKHCTTG